MFDNNSLSQFYAYVDLRLLTYKPDHIDAKNVIYVIYCGGKIRVI